MKYLKTKHVCIGFVLLGVVSLQACKDDVLSYDIKGDPNTLAYVTTVGQTPVNGSTNQVTFKVAQTPIGTFGDVGFKFPVRLNKTTNDITAMVTVDNSLVQEYNAKYGTSCLPLPENVIEINNTALEIKQGETQSTDSVSLAVGNTTLSALDPGDYLVPLKLASVSDGAHISSNLNTVYVKIQVTETQAAKENVSSAGMLGTRITNYTGWTYTSSQATGNISNLWNTRTTNYLTLTSNPATIIFDMKAINKVSGIRLYSRSGTTAANTLTHVKFSLSKDGNTYTEIADFPREKMNTESGYQYISMYGAVEAQYLKLELASPLNGLVFLGVYTVQ